MKLAICGKGGVGKTTIAAALAVAFAKENKSVIAIDADPDSNLLATLGYPELEKIRPLSQYKELIEERTGSKAGTGIFKINPKVDDIPEKFCVTWRGVRILVMGTLKRGGGGCLCPENAFLKALLSHLVLTRDETLILDMVAGIEHLGRATAGGVDGFIIVVEPSLRSIETSRRIRELAEDIGVRRSWFLANKVRLKSEEEFIKGAIGDVSYLGAIKFYEGLHDGVNEELIDRVEELIMGALNSEAKSQNRREDSIIWSIVILVIVYCL